MRKVSLPKGKKGFMTVYKLNDVFDLRKTAKNLPEGVVACLPKLIAGPDHIEAILIQAAEYWSRNETLAKNRSIDLLMRITCRRQIAEAVSASGISSTSEVAIFGCIDRESQAEESEQVIRSMDANLETRDDLLSVSKAKLDFLKEFQGLPEWFNEVQLLTALKEKSVLLVFDK
jgi:tRNA threonylcarbamoyladenosine modification (KEOPS) complex Cgi121 subunit